MQVDGKNSCRLGEIERSMLTQCLANHTDVLGKQSYMYVQCPEFHQAIRMAICRLDTVPKDDWGTAEDEAKAAREVSNLLSQDLQDQDYCFSTASSTALILSPTL